MHLPRARGSSEASAHRIVSESPARRCVAASDSCGGRSGRIGTRLDPGELENQRLEGMSRFAQHLNETGALRRGMDVGQARDILWTINSHEVHRMLVTERGRSRDQYREWLARTLVRELLVDGSQLRRPQ
jgi:hypothetical protein